MVARRERAQRLRLARIDRDRAREIDLGVIGALRIEQKGAGMIGEVVIVGRGIARSYREIDCLLPRAAGGEGAAGMSIAVDPVGMVFQQPFVGKGGLGMAAAVAE